MCVCSPCENDWEKRDNCSNRLDTIANNNLCNLFTVHLHITSPCITNFAKPLKNKCSQSAKDKLVSGNVQWFPLNPVSHFPGPESSQKWYSQSSVKNCINIYSSGLSGVYCRCFVYARGSALLGPTHKTTRQATSFVCIENSTIAPWFGSLRLQRPTDGPIESGMEWTS